MAANAGGLNQLCTGLSQENIEKLSGFLGEANMLQAQNGHEAVDVEEALRYLRACHFSPTKALDIFKNYQKSSETYQLESLRPYREPLCSGIGSRKMEVVGTKDSEGYPIVLFTVSRHETFKSDHKADMQLLFYTLDQAFESEVAAREKGIVFIIDFRDSQLGDIRYITSVMSVLRDGYPIHTKAVYLVSTKRVSKVITAFQKMAKYDLDKMKIVDFAELGSYFTPEQLPLSLGGTYVPRTTSPTHHPPHQQHHPHQHQQQQQPTQHRQAGVRDNAAPAPQRAPHPPAPERGGSDGSSSKGKEAELAPHSSSNGRSVNRLLELFESSTTESSKSHPTSPNKTRPLPPSKASKPTPPKKVSGDPPHQQQQQAVKKTQSHGNDDMGKGKVPLLPPPKFPKKSNSIDGLSAEASGSSGKPPSKPSFPPSSGRGKEAGGLDSSAGAKVFNKMQGMFKRMHTNTSDASPHPKTTPPPVKAGAASSDDAQIHREFLARQRADSAGNTRISSSHGGALSASSSPKRPHVPLQVLSSPPGNRNPSSVEPGMQRSSSDSAGTSKNNPLQKRGKPPPSGYENVALSKASSSPPLTRPPPPQQDDEGYENVSFSNRDSSEVYENIGIGFAGSGDHMTGPLPPLPYGKQSKQSYENVEIGKKLSPAKGKGSKERDKVVEDDDDEMLFGKEGPPGMQETIYENFGPDKANKLMTIEELAAHVEKLGKKGLATEYLRVRNDPITGTHKTCKLPCNAPKNRYKDVICLDETRVKLKSLPGKEGSDYIHANFVDGYKKPEAFILTQGPKEKTVVDFWRMVWEQQVRVIVMVTKCVEVGKRKCAQYWPDTSPCSAKHGQYTIAVTDIHKCDGYDVTTLHLAFKGTERTLFHFQFLAWPDYGIPTSGSSIIRLIFAVRRAQDRLCQGSSGLHPILVHCSAGVGRSGAFCSLDNCMHEIDKQRKLNFQGTVRKMRKQRAFAIQTEEQYEFCYRTLLEYAKQ